MSDLVTIVVPVYNVQNYLSRCVDSLIGQTYKNIEILLIDDGSTDRSSTICDELSKKDERIIVYHKANGGLSSARNYGIDKAKGTYIAFIDSDDWVEIDFVEVLTTSMEKSGADIACCGFRIINETGDLLAEKKCKENILFNQQQALEDLLLDKNLKNVAWNKLYKSSLFCNIRYPEGRNYEDVATTYKLILLSNSVVVVGKSLNYYFFRSGSIIHTVSEKNLIDWIWAHSTRREEIETKVEKSTIRISDILFHYTLVKRSKRSKDSDVKKIGSEYQYILRRELFAYGIIALFKRLNATLLLKIMVTAWLL